MRKISNTNKKIIDPYAASKGTIKVKRDNNNNPFDVSSEDIDMRIFNNNLIFLITYIELKYLLIIHLTTNSFLEIKKWK